MRSASEHGACGVATGRTHMEQRRQVMVAVLSAAHDTQEQIYLHSVPLHVVVSGFVRGSARHALAEHVTLAVCTLEGENRLMLSPLPLLLRVIERNA